MGMSDAQLSVGALSETGYLRDENQDRMSGDAFPIGNLFIVADGMGGYSGGALAAEMTIGHLREDIGNAHADSPVEDTLISAIKRASKVIYDRSHSADLATAQMGSTAVVLLISGQVTRVAHVGDSRAYLFRGGSLFRLTTDHTRVQKMVEEGILQKEEAEIHPESHILERAIGIREEVAVDISDEMIIVDGDAFLLCSDGLSGFVTDAEIESVLRSGVTAQEIPKILIDKALDTGGKDNITVQFIQYGTRRECIANDAIDIPDANTKTNRATYGWALLISLLAVLIFAAGLWVVN